MTWRAKIRVTTKWTSTAVVVLLVIVMLMSRWTLVSWVKQSGTQLQVAEGCFTVFTFKPGAQQQMKWYITPGLHVEHPDLMEFKWMPWQVDTAQMALVMTPLWIPAVPFACVAIAAWVLDWRALRRSRRGCCTRCHYSRAGLAADAACPECGEGVAIKAGVASMG